MRVADLLPPLGGLFEHLERVITLDRARRYCFALADTPGPSGTIRFTRGRVLLDLLRGDDLLHGLRAHHDYLGSGNVALATGDASTKPIWMVAHLDQCSYLIDRAEGARYRLVPSCYHMIRTGAVPALALDCADDPPRRLARGSLETEANGEAVYFAPTELAEPLRRGTRVVVEAAAHDLPEGCVTGVLDDAFGCAALALAAAAVAPYRPEALFVFTDDEEGPVSTGNLTFARGCARLVSRAATHLPRLAVVVDSHEAEDMADGPAPRDLRPGDGACFGESASRGRGGITPPRLYGFQRELSAFLAERGVRLRENADGYFSRSDCAPLSLATPNVALVGYLLAHRHFDGVPRAHLADLIDLARALAIYALVAQSSAWRCTYLGPED